MLNDKKSMKMLRKAIYFAKICVDNYSGHLNYYKETFL